MPEFRFLLDESVDLRLRAQLRAKGHDTTAIGADYPRSITDREVLAIAVTETRIVITNDRDFGELIFKNALEHRGVIYLRLSSQRLADIVARLDEVILSHSHRLAGFVVVTDDKVRPDN